MCMGFDSTVCGSTKDIYYRYPDNYIHLFVRL